MAHVYAGELSRIDNEVFEAVKALPDDFWVFFEVTIERNIDVLIIRPTPRGASTLIVTELKHFSRPVMGGADGPWMRDVDAGQWEEIPANGTDINPYWQAVNAGNAMREWLWNNQRLYLASPEPRTSEDFKVWPDLLLLSPPGTNHRLPLNPPSRYGRWWFSAQTWVEHVRGWTPKVGIPLTDAEVFSLVQLLRLKPLWNEYRPPVAPVKTESTLLPDHLHRLESLLLRLEDRLARLDGRLDGLERQASPEGTSGIATPPTSLPSSDGAAGASGHARGETASLTHAPGAPLTRDLTSEEKAAIVEAVEQVRRQGKSRALPTILMEANRILGYSLKERQYNGFGLASAMFGQALAEGVIRYGPLSGPNPTIYLADEAIPA